MEERDITVRVVELVEYARLLNAAWEDENPPLLAAVAAQLQGILDPLHEVLECGPKSWGNAGAGAWLAMHSAESVTEELSLPDVDWDRIGAEVSFAMGGVEILSDKWNQMLERNI